MKKIRLNVAGIIACLALVLTLSSATSKKFVNARYTQSNQGSFCNIPTTLPAVCSPTVTAQLCTTAFGALTRTWYQDACQTPYYREP